MKKFTALQAVCSLGVMAVLATALLGFSAPTKPAFPLYTFDLRGTMTATLDMSASPFLGAMDIRHVVGSRGKLRVTGGVDSGSGALCVVLKDYAGNICASVYCWSGTTFHESKQFIGPYGTKMWRLFAFATDASNTTHIDSVSVVVP